MKKRNHVINIIFLAALFLMPGAWADNSRRTVRLWTFAPNNAAEWESQRTVIESKFNISLDIQQVAQNVFVEKLLAEMQGGGKPPDIIDWMIENNRVMSADPQKSLVLPLEEYARRSQVFSSLPAGRTAWCTYGGHIYGLPREVCPVVLVYNDTLWKSAGVDLAKIQTWDEFFLAAKKLIGSSKISGQASYALPYGNNGLQNSMYLIWQQTGADFLDSVGRPQFTSPEFTTFVKKWREWTASGVFCDWDWGQFDAMLMNGTLASYTAPDWWVSRVDMAARNGKYQFRVRPLPVYRAGGPRTASWGGTFLAIPKSASGRTANPFGDRDNTAQLYKIMEYMQYEVDDAVMRMRDTGMIPAAPGAWTNPYVQTLDPRFGGQKLIQLQCELAREMPVMKTGDIFWDAINDFTEWYALLEEGKITVEECLRQTQDAALKRLR